MTFGLLCDEEVSGHPLSWGNRGYTGCSLWGLVHHMRPGNPHSNCRENTVKNTKGPVLYFYSVCSTCAKNIKSQVLYFSTWLSYTHTAQFLFFIRPDCPSHESFKIFVGGCCRQGRERCRHRQNGLGDRRWHAIVAQKRIERRSSRRRAGPVLSQSRESLGDI